MLDHTHTDGDLVRRWQGGDVDLTRRLPSDLILSAATVDPRIGSASPGYLAMLELPSCLEPVEPLARAVYESGWRPEYSAGPTRNELVDLVAAAVRDGGVDSPQDASSPAVNGGSGMRAACGVL